MLPGLLDDLCALKSRWDLARPAGGRAADELWRQFRMRWNYHSNHIEGNTLTYGETELLLIHGRTTGDHLLREYEEMKAHDVAIEHIRELAADVRPLTEGDVRNLNRISLKEPFWKAALTADGQATRKRIVPGEYKEAPNNVITATGEIFYFADPLEVPAKMAALMRWLAAEVERPTAHPVETAARLHYEFVRIHPFDDGNGRVARLLMNYVMLRAGYPPVIIKTEDKRGYLTALQKADVGELEAFSAYVAEEARWSLKFALSFLSAGAV